MGPRMLFPNLLPSFLPLPALEQSHHRGRMSSDSQTLTLVTISGTPPWPLCFTPHSSQLRLLGWDGGRELPCKQLCYSWSLAPGKEPNVSNGRKRRDALAGIPAPDRAPAPAKDQSSGWGQAPAYGEDNSHSTFLLCG